MKVIGEKNWFAKHPVWTVILVLFVIGIIGNILQNSNNTQSTTTQAATNQQPRDVWSKTAGYSVADCYSVCEATYDMEIQVSVCQNNCDNYGKPSASLDKYVNTVKDIKNK